MVGYSVLSVWGSHKSGCGELLRVAADLLPQQRGAFRAGCRGAATT
jgi:hypothetical protein